MAVTAAVSGEAGVLGGLGGGTAGRLSQPEPPLVLETSLMKKQKQSKNLRLSMSTFLGQQTKLFRESGQVIRSRNN